MKIAKFSKKCFFVVDERGDQANFAIPLNTGLPKSQDRRSWFSQILGLQIGTQFCPDLDERKREITVGVEVEFFVARKLRSTAGSLKSTYRVVNTTF